MENEKRYLDGCPKTLVYGDQREAHRELGTLEKAIAQYSERYSRDIHNNQGCELLGAMRSIDLALGHLSLDRDNAGYSLVKKLLKTCREEIEAAYNAREFVSELASAL